MTPDQLVALAVELQQRGLTDAARMNLEAALAIDPDHVPALATLSGFLTLKWLPETGLILARRAIGLAPGRGDVLATLAAAFSNLGRYAEARDTYLAAFDQISLPSARAIILRNLGIIYQNMGLYERSFAAHTAADTIEPPTPEQAHSRA